MPNPSVEPDARRRESAQATRDSMPGGSKRSSSTGRLSFGYVSSSPDATDGFQGKRAEAQQEPDSATSAAAQEARNRRRSNSIKVAQEFRGNQVELCISHKSSMYVFVGLHDMAETRAFFRPQAFAPLASTISQYHKFPQGQSTPCSVGLLMTRR